MVQIVGTGVDGSGAESAVSVGEGMQTVPMGEGWRGLNLVRFSAEEGGVQMGVALGEVVYELISGC